MNRFKINYNCGQPYLGKKYASEPVKSERIHSDKNNFPQKRFIQIMCVFYTTNKIAGYEKVYTQFVYPPFFYTKFFPITILDT